MPKGPASFLLVSHELMGKYVTLFNITLESPPRLTNKHDKKMPKTRSPFHEFRLKLMWKYVTLFGINIASHPWQKKTKTATNRCPTLDLLLANFVWNYWEICNFVKYYYWITSTAKQKQNKTETKRSSRFDLRLASFGWNYCEYVIFATVNRGPPPQTSTQTKPCRKDAQDSTSFLLVSFEYMGRCVILFGVTLEPPPHQTKKTATKRCPKVRSPPCEFRFGLWKGCVMLVNINLESHVQHRKNGNGKMPNVL